jgi:hypothetical protein
MHVHILQLMEKHHPENQFIGGNFEISFAIVSPALDNTCSEGADVAGMQT